MGGGAATRSAKEAEAGLSAMGTLACSGSGNVFPLRESAARGQHVGALAGMQGRADGAPRTGTKTVEEVYVVRPERERPGSGGCAVTSSGTKQVIGSDA